MFHQPLSPPHPSLWLLPVLMISVLVAASCSMIRNSMAMSVTPPPVSCPTASNTASGCCLGSFQACCFSVDGSPILLVRGGPCLLPDVLLTQRSIFQAIPLWWELRCSQCSSNKMLQSTTFSCTFMFSCECSVQLILLLNLLGPLKIERF